MKAWANNKGFSLLEVVMSLAIIGVISMAVLNTFINGFSWVSSAGRISRDNFLNQAAADSALMSCIPNASATFNMTLYDASGLNPVLVTVNGGTATNGEFTVFIPGVAPILVPVTGVTLDQSLLQVLVSAQTILTAEILPATASNTNVLWSSSDPAVATVNGGVVIGQAIGSTIITVTTEDGGMTATCTVNITG